MEGINFFFSKFATSFKVKTSETPCIFNVFVLLQRLKSWAFFWVGSKSFCPENIHVSQGILSFPGLENTNIITFILSTESKF